MQDRLQRHPLFEAFEDPVSGVVSYLLKPVVAPVQQTFYYVNPSLAPDERWLWMHCAWPPAPAKTLALVSLDPEKPVVRHFPQGQFPTAQPLVMSDGGVLLGSGDALYKMDVEGNTAHLFSLPAGLCAGGTLKRLATHLSLSADGRSLLLDVAFLNHWFVGVLDLPSGEFRVIREFDSHHNHAQFSPVNPDLFLIARDKHTDPVTGKFSHHSQRTFLMNVQGTRYECINPEHQCRAFHGACHEWWSADGWACYIDYDLGAYEFNHVSGETTHVWTEPLCHAHCSADRRFWCADESPYKWADAPCKVLFFDRESGRRTEIQSGMPMPAGDYWAQRERYHIDPHPQFSPKGSAVVYTATDGGGRPTVALTPIKNCLGT